MLDLIGHIMLAVLVIILLGLYLWNIWKLIKAAKAQKFTLQTIARAVGVFVPVVGIVMGMV